MKVALVCSAGGHLTEMKQLEKCYMEYDHFFVTFKRDDTKEIGNACFVTDPKRSPLKLAKNIIESFVVFLKERPDVIMTTGAGVAIPFCILSKTFGKKVVYLESYCRTDNPSMTGRVLYHIADVFLVQWEEMLGKYGSKAMFWGRVI